MKYFLIAGEASGDLHASHLIAALRERDAEAEFRFYGGDLMEEAATAPASATAEATVPDASASAAEAPAPAATAPAAAAAKATAPAATAPAAAAAKATDPRCSAAPLIQPALNAGTSPLLRHYSTLAYMGFVQVALHARTILRGLAECKRAIADFRPDAVILIDYPGFNLKIAKWAKRELPATPIYYYISPKIWAWKEHRINDIRANVDRLFSILPFEVDFYEGKHHYPISYVGNPTYDEVCAFLDHYAPIERGSEIALLPGSRKQEISDNLRIMLAAVGQHPHTIAAAPGIDDAFYAAFAPKARIVRGRTYELLASARAALVTSGTATLEAALLDCPQVVCYNIHGGRIVNWAKEHFLKCRYISLVNLIANAEVVPELIAADMNQQNVGRHLSAILDGPAREAQLRGYALVRERLATPGAPQRAAEEMVALLKARQ